MDEAGQGREEGSKGSQYEGGAKVPGFECEETKGRRYRQCRGEYRHTGGSGECAQADQGFGIIRR